MGGTLRGRLDCYANSGNGSYNTLTMFKVLYDFLKSHPNMTEIARHGGSGGTAANTGDYDSATPFLQNAWYVFRMNDATLESGAANPTGYSGPRTYPWYIYVQLYRQDIVGGISSTPAVPSAMQAVTGNTAYTTMATQYVVPVGTIAGTSEVAWNGAGTMGTNTKGTPVWKSTAGTPTGFQGCYVSPRSNNIGGAHATNRENCSPIFSTNSAQNLPCRFNIISDDDMLIFTSSYGDDASWGLEYFGFYTPRPGLTPTVPMFHYASSIPHATGNNTYGTVAGNGNCAGGIFMNNLAVDGVRSSSFSRYNEFFTQFSNPNRMFTNDQWDDWRIPILLYEGTTYVGYAGDLDSTIKETYNLNAGDTNPSKTRMVLGNNIAQSFKLTVPWDGTTVLRSNFKVRSGVVW